MGRQKVVGHTMLPSHTECKVLYNEVIDMVEIEVGGTSLKFQANSFFVMHEMLRKAAARIVMQTEIN
jgi:hypothetical protein